MFNLDIYAKAKIGKSLAGIKLGEKLESFLPYIDQTIDENKVQWNVDPCRQIRTVKLGRF